MKLIDLFEQQKIIEGDVLLSDKRITKLDFKNAHVNGTFDCSRTQITSLEGAPSSVSKDFWCSYTQITSLEGAPEHVGGDFNCVGTDQQDLHNVHKIIKHIGNTFVLSVTIKSHVLGVMFIKGLKKIQFIRSSRSDQNVHGDEQQVQVTMIINKHLSGNRNPHECQEELIEAGLSGYAKL